MNTSDGSAETFMCSLSAAMDVLARDRESPQQAPPGRIQQYDTAEGRIIAPVITPTSADLDAATWRHLRH